MMKRFGNDKEEEESRMLEKLRNLSLTATDYEPTGNRIAREDEEFP
jgi:hypothetical protein